MIDCTILRYLYSLKKLIYKIQFPLSRPFMIYVDFFFRFMN